MQEVVERLKVLDKNAEDLFPKLLKHCGVTLDRKTGECIEDHAYHLLFDIGIPELIFRLECQQTREQRSDAPQDELARAKMWRHVAEASKPMSSKTGDGSISDINDKTVLNPWLPASAKKFAGEMAARKCESCGNYWEMYENHFDKTGMQSIDQHKTWFCWWCAKESVVRKHFGIEFPQEDCCALCKQPRAVVPVGGHIPVKDSDTDWVCAFCVRANPPLLVGTSVVIPKAMQPKKPKQFRCAWHACGKGIDEKGNRVRGVAPGRGEYCSKDCKKLARLREKDRAKNAIHLASVLETGI
jgi:hypothetical protein